MAYVEFDGALDDEKSSGFVEFTGELDAPDGGQRPLLPKDTESGVGKLIGDSLSGGLDVLQETLPRPIASTIAALRGKAVAGRGASVLEGKKLEEPAYDESELTRLSSRAAAEAADPKNSKRNAPSMSAPTGRLVTASGDGIIGRASDLISAQGRQTTAGALQLGSDVAGAVGLDSVSSTLGQAASGSSDIAKDLQRGVSMRAEQGGALDKYAPQVLAQLPQIGVAMLSGGITLPSVLSGLSSYAEARERGIDPVKAFQFAGGMGVAEAIGEKLGGTGKVVDAFESAFKNGFNRSAIANLSGSMLAAGVREVPSEEVTYGLQYGLESNYGVNPNPTTEGFLEGAKDTGIVSAGAGAAMGGAGAIGALATKPRSPQEAAARALSDALSGGSFDPAATTRAADSIFGSMSVDGSGVNRTGAALVEAERAKLNAMRTTAAVDLSAAPDVDSAIAAAERMVSVPATGPVESAVKAAQTQAATDAAVASNPVSVNKDALLSNAYAAAGITDTASGATDDAGAATPVQGAAEGRTQLDTAGVPGAPASGEQSQRTTAPALNRVGYTVNLTGGGNATPQLQNLPEPAEAARNLDSGLGDGGTQVPVRVDAGESGRIDGLRAAIERGNQLLGAANERRKLRGEQPDPNTPRLNPASDEDSRAVLSIGRLLTERFGGPQYAVVPYADNRPGSANGFEIGGQAFVNVGTPSRNVAGTSLHEWHHTIQRLAEYDIRRGISDSPAIRYVDQVDALFDSMSPAGKTAYISNFLRKAEIDALKRSMAGKDQAAINVAVNKLIRDALRSEELRKEMVADFVGNRATDKDFINSLAEADPKGFKAFAQQWLKIIDGLIKKLTGNGKRGESDKVDEYLSDLNEAKRVLREAMVRYSSDRQAEAAAQNDGGDAQYSRGVVAEVAPNPDQTDVKTSWDEMTPQEREQATKAVANKTVQRISDMLGLRGWSFALSSGKYEGDINPNILIEAPESATIEQLDEFARALGYVLDQKAMVAFDEENTTSESQAGFVKVVLPRQMSTKEVDSLRKFIAEKVPQADGDTLREGALVFGNFSGYNDKVETLTDEQYGDAIAAAVAEFGWTGEEIKVSEPQRYHSNLIWPDNRDGYLKGTRYGEGGEIQDGAGRDDVRGRQGRDLAQLREVAKDAIALRDRWIGARAAARGRGAGDSQAANGAREVGSPEREYGTPREGAVSAVGVHFSKERRSRITSSSFGSGLKGLERERLTDPANSDIKPRINFYASNGRGVIPEAGVGGITHTVKLNNLYPVKADPLKLVKNMKGATPAERASYFERSVMKAGFDGYLDNNTGGSQDFAVLIGKHDIEMPRYSRDFVESPDDINDLGAFNIDTFDFDAKTDEKIDGDSMADIANELTDAGYGVSGVVASKPTDWKQVPDKAIKGITPEAAFPMPEFAENEYGNLTAPVYAGGTQVRLELQPFGLADENLWTAFTGGLRIDADWGTPLSMRGASRKEAADYLHRMAAAKELTYRGFDFYKSVPAKSAKRIGEFWSAVPDIPGATEFAAGTPEVDGNSTEKLRQVAQARLVGKGYSVQVDSTKDFFFLQFRNKATGEIDEASIQLVGRPRGVDQQSVVLHAVNLNKGSGVGKMFYSIANTWANVVGVKVLADPDGLTAVNSVRRTENALSAAARTKGEALLEPGWAQRVYGFDGKAKTPDAKRKNLTRIALAQARNVYELAPDFEGVRYDLDTQSFVNEDGSNADAKVKGIMSRSEVRRFSLGRTSFIRAALTNELVDGEIALPDEMGEPIMYSRNEAFQYMDGRNRSMAQVSPNSTQLRDIAQAMRAVNELAAQMKPTYDRLSNRLEGEELNKAVMSEFREFVLPVGRTPHVLTMLGAPNSMMRIDPSIVYKVFVQKHANHLEDAKIKDIIEGIYKPALVLGGDNKNEYELVLPIVTSTGPIIVPVMTNTDSAYGVKTTAIMSAYPKKVSLGGKSVLQRIKDGKLVYADPALAQVALTGNAAPQAGINARGAKPVELSPGTPPARMGAISVNQPGSLVKPFNMYYVGWDKARDDVMGAIASRKAKTDVDLMAWIGDKFKGDWSDAPSFSRNQMGLYSALERGLESLTANSAPANGWKDAIKGLVNKGAVKADEVEWSGVNDWLDLQSGKVTKDSVLEYLRGNGVQVEEVVLGKVDRMTVEDALEFLANREGSTTDDVLDNYGYADEDDYIRLVRKIKGEASLDSKYGKYTLPGGENYREVLLTLPDKVADAIARFIEIKKDGDVYRVSDESGPLKSFRTADEAMRYRAELHRADQEKGSKVSGAYRSSHWDQPNVLAHIRVNDRSDADGKRVLFVEEIQSDWGQEGKKKGFAGEPDGWFVVADGDEGFFNTKAEAEAAARQYGGVVRPAFSAESQAEKIPLAPFVTKTDGWLNLALKRVIAMAVDGGYDKVAFTTGAQNAERFSLDKRVSKIEYASSDSNPAPDRALTVYGLDGQEVLSKNATEQELPDLIGKEIADRLLQSEPKSIGGRAKFHTLSGLDLKVEAKGMRAFYDSIVPNAAKVLLKKVGGGQLEVVAIPDANAGREVVAAQVSGESMWGVYDRQKGQWLESWDNETYTSDPENAELTSEKTAKNIASAIMRDAGVMLEQPGFTITDAMREKVSTEGLPMFSRAQPYAGQNFAMPGESLLSQQRRIFQDYFLPVLEVQEALTNQGGVMSEATDVYRAEERMYGRVEETLRDFRQKWFDPMIEKAQANDITMDELSLYAYAKHAKERNAHIQRLRSDMPDNGSGMSNDEADDILTMFNVNGQTAILEDLHGDLMAITAATRREMLDTDLITQDEYDQMDSMFSNYVPLRGFEDVDLDGSKKPIRGGGKGFNIRGKETVRALGRRTRAGNIIENIVIDYEKAVFRGERNFVGQVFLNMIQQNPDPKLWEIDAERTRTAYDRQTGRVARTREIDKGEDTIAVKIRGREVYVKIYDERLLRAMRKASKDETGQIERFVNATFGQFNGLIRSTLTQYNPIFAFVNAARDVQSGGVAVLDELGAKGVALYAKHYRAALASAGRHQLGKLDANGVAGTFFGDPTMDRYFEEYRAAGGTTGGYYGKSAEDVQQEIRNVLLAAGAAPKNLMERVKTFGGSGAGRKVMRGVQSAGKVLEFLGATSENAARVAAYRAAREMGRSPAESASIAKNLTTNFNRKGEWGQVLNGMFLFFNAAIQGSHRVLKALKRGRVQGLMAGLTAAGMSSVALALAVGGDDEDDGQAYWDKIPAFEKERNFIIMLPPGAEMDGVEKVGSNGRYLKIPMPYGFNVFPAIGVQIADAVRHQQDETRGVTIGKATTNIVNAIMGSFNPLGGAIDPSSGTSMMMAALPTAFDLGLQLAEGVDGFNRPTSPYKSEFDLDPDSENVNARQAGGVFHMIARGMNRATGGDEATAGAIDVAPGTLENLWKNLTGGTGTFLSDVFVNLPTKLAQPEAEVTPRDIPLLRNFYGMVDGVNDSSLLYERRREILRAKTEEKNRADKDMEPSSDPMEIALASLAKLSNQYTKQISALRKEEIALAQDAEMSTAEKNIRRKEIKMQRDELAREFNAAYMETMRSKRDGDFDAE